MRTACVIVSTSRTPYLFLPLQANCALIGTNPFPDDTATALAARRGIVISHHHYDLVGSNVFSWPLPGDDWDWATNAGTMSYVWRASIAAQADYPEVRVVMPQQLQGADVAQMMQLDVAHCRRLLRVSRCPAGGVVDRPARAER